MTTAGATRAGDGDDHAAVTGTDSGAGRAARRRSAGEPVETGLDRRVDGRPARTSAAAAFALAVGVAAVVCVLTVILSPVGLVLGVLGLILGIVGIRAARKVGITGKGVATTGLVLSVLSVVAAVAFAVGAVTVLNNQSAVDRLNQQVQNLRDKLPTQVVRAP
ncbi:hypothetical protein GCM10027047_39320 [Rhodococcus aerolatus]